MATQLDTPPLAPAATSFALSGPGGTMTLDSRTIETLAEFFVGALDCGGGDPDREPNGDEQDQSYPEAAAARGHVIRGGASAHEDDEDADPAEDDDNDSAVDDRPCDEPLQDLEQEEGY
jgi:hypothetical protein